MYFIYIYCPCTLKNTTYTHMKKMILIIYGTKFLFLLNALLFLQKTMKKNKIRKIKKIRDRQNRKRKREIDLENKIEDYFKSETPVFPHPLHMLSERDWKRYKKNSIVLSNLIYKKNKQCSTNLL